MNQDLQSLRDYISGIQEAAKDYPLNTESILDKIVAKITELENRCQGCGCQNCIGQPGCRYCLVCKAGVEDYRSETRLDCWDRKEGVRVEGD